MVSRPLVNNTSIFSPSHTTVSVQPNVSIAQGSFLNGGVSRADLPLRSLAQFGVLSKYESFFLDNPSREPRSSRLHNQIYDFSDPNSFLGSLAPIQGLPGAAQLDMNVSCLFMHEVWRRQSIASELFSENRLFHFSYVTSTNMVNIKTWSISTKIKMMNRNVEEWQSLFSLYLLFLSHSTRLILCDSITYFSLLPCSSSYLPFSSLYSWCKYRGKESKTSTQLQRKRNFKQCSLFFSPSALLLLFLTVDVEDRFRY